MTTVQCALRDAQHATPGAGARPEVAGARPSPPAPPPAAAPPASRDYAKHVSAHLPKDADERLTRRNRRYGQLQVLWAESSLPSVRKCRRVRREDEVTIRAREGVAHYCGLVTCSSIWGCPVDQAKIRNVRAAEISLAAANWVNAGNSVFQAAFTMPHDFGMRLAPLFDVIANGFRAVIRGRPWRRLKDELGIVGQIRAVEVTYGLNGWHPHLHVLVFVIGDRGAYDLADLELDRHPLQVYFRDRWAAFVVAAGYRPPHEDHGVKVGRCYSAAEAGAYIAKTQDGKSVGNEMTRADLKTARGGHRTPLEVLEDFRWTGDEGQLALWREYERATKGRQCITWSKGLRKILAADPERTDEEIAAEEVGGEGVAVLPAAAWSGIVRIAGLPAAVLDAAEIGGVTAINELLGKYGIPLAWAVGRHDEQAQHPGGEGPAP